MTCQRITVIETKVVKTAFSISFKDECYVYVPTGWKRTAEEVLSQQATAGGIDLDKICDEINARAIF